MPSRKKSKESRGRSSPKGKRKAGPYARFVKAHFHEYYQPGKDHRAAFARAIKKVAMAYRKSR